MPKKDDQSVEVGDVVRQSRNVTKFDQNDYPGQNDDTGPRFEVVSLVEERPTVLARNIATNELVELAVDKIEKDA
jgi:hypothetical protein